jgi:hypothetical protein
MGEFVPMVEISPFEEDGFRSGFHLMPGLNIGVQFRPNQYFRCDGLVNSLGGYVHTLPEALREPLLSYDFSGKGGFNLKLETDKEEGYLMVVLDISPRANVFNQAHEAAEVIIKAGQCEKLQTFINSQRLTVNLAELSPHEIGNVCGFAAALSTGYSRVEMTKLIKDNQDFDNINLLKRLNLI